MLGWIIISCYELIILYKCFCFCLYSSRVSIINAYPLSAFFNSIKIIVALLMVYLKYKNGTSMQQDAEK
jgi:hypothetical protein